MFLPRGHRDSWNISEKEQGHFGHSATSLPVSSMRQPSGFLPLCLLSLHFDGPFSSRSSLLWQGPKCPRLRPEVLLLWLLPITQTFSVSPFLPDGLACAPSSLQLREGCGRQTRAQWLWGVHFLAHRGSGDGQKSPVCYPQRIVLSLPVFSMLNPLSGEVWECEKGDPYSLPTWSAVYFQPSNAHISTELLPHGANGLHPGQSKSAGGAVGSGPRRVQPEQWANRGKSPHQHPRAVQWWRPSDTSVLSCRSCCTAACGLKTTGWTRSTWRWTTPLWSAPYSGSCWDPCRSLLPCATGVDWSCNTGLWCCWES